MKLKEIITVLEEFAPSELQAEYDNAGLLVGDCEAEVESALACVDVTESVVQEAIERGAGVIIAHHPLVFRPLHHITGETYIERCVAQAIRHNVAIYALHTNLDRVAMSQKLGEIVGLTNLRPLPSGDGFGVVGQLKQETGTVEYLREVMALLDLPVIRHSAIVAPTVECVALCTGAGRDMVAAARSAGAQLYLSAEFRHNDFLDAEQITIADIGHWESEFCACEIIEAIIRKKIPTFAVCISERGENPVKYLL